jgi:phosphohistidine phosphatase
MRLYLVHHGDAVGADVDSMRPLSVAGRAAVESLAQRAAGRGVKPAVISHSGKLRARQTAEIFWRACNPLAEYSATRGLQPDDPPRWIAEALAGEARDIMLVGHMPHLDGLLRLLLGGDPRGAAPPFPMHGIVELEKKEGDTRWTQGARDV